MNEKERTHHGYLENLVNHIELVGEKRHEIVSIITEPVWTPFNNKHELCDLILLYRNFQASAVELKGSPNFNRRSKAISQIRSGKEYIESVIRYDFRYGLFVVYNNGRYIYDRINL